jgi:hypothetical protein
MHDHRQSHLLLHQY